MKAPHIKINTLVLVFILLLAGLDCSQTQPVSEDITGQTGRNLDFASETEITGNWKQLRIIRDFKADVYIRSITKPFLFLFAENDELVNPEWALEDFRKIFPDGPPPFIETYVADGQNHSFRLSPACYRGEWEDLQYSESLRMKMAEWLTLQLQQ